ncbi:MAG: ribbon-helix-helix protein, CopG family [Pseudomonadota bacterium]
MKKTTIYLEDSELELLKQKAFMLKTSVAEIIRKSIKALCSSPTSEEEKAMKLLTKIRGSVNTDERVNKEIIDIQRELRNERKGKGRR